MTSVAGAPIGRRRVKEGNIAAVAIGHESRIPIPEVERLLGEQRPGSISLYARLSRPAQTADVEQKMEYLERWVHVPGKGP